MRKITLIKSFCFFWLSPKEESPLTPQDSNPPSNADSAFLLDFPLDSANRRIYNRSNGGGGFVFIEFFWIKLDLSLLIPKKFDKCERCTPEQIEKAFD